MPLACHSREEALHLASRTKRELPISMKESRQEQSDNNSQTWLRRHAPSHPEVLILYPHGSVIVQKKNPNKKTGCLRSYERYFQPSKHPSWQSSTHSEGSISILCPMCKQKPCCNPKRACVRMCMCLRACLCANGDWSLLIVPATWTADKQLITED